MCKERVTQAQFEMKQMQDHDVWSTELSLMVQSNQNLELDLRNIIWCSGTSLLSCPHLNTWNLMSSLRISGGQTDQT